MKTWAQIEERLKEGKEVDVISRGDGLEDDSKEKKCEPFLLHLYWNNQLTKRRDGGFWERGIIVGEALEMEGLSLRGLFFVWA